MAEEKKTDTTEEQTQVDTVVTKDESVVTAVNTEGTQILKQTESIIIFKANRPLMDHEYDELEKRVRLENEKSGLKIVLAPYSVDVEITGG